MGGDDGFRCMACDDQHNLEADSDILRIPLTACLTGDTAEELANKLAFEKSIGVTSKYEPYINVLPKLDQLQGLPRFWNTLRLESVTDGGRLLETMAAQARPEVDPWALACVDSRANFLSDFSWSMTPILDMFNHDCTVKTSARVQDNNLLLNVQPSFDKNQEVRISYGDLSNLETLCNYGFVTADNPCNTEVVTVRIIRRAPLPLEIAGDGSIDPSAIATLRQYLANAQELESTQSFSEPVSDRNELDVFSLVAYELSEASQEAKRGAEASRKDPLVASYLHARANLLEKAVKVIERAFPDVEY